MADVAEFFFDTVIEEEEEEGGGIESLLGDYHDDTGWYSDSSVVEHPHGYYIGVGGYEEEDDDDGDFHLQCHSREDYDVDVLSSVFTRDFVVSNQPLGSRISLEDDSESSVVEEGSAYDINLDDRRFRRLSVGGDGGMDADGDLLDLMGLGGESDYLDVGLGDGLGLGYGLDVEERNFDDNVDCSVFGEDDVDVLDRSVDGFLFGCGSDRDATGYDRDEVRSCIVGYESGSESVDERATLGGEELSRTGGYESELEVEGTLGSEELLRTGAYDSELELEGTLGCEELSRTDAYESELELEDTLGCEELSRTDAYESELELEGTLGCEELSRTDAYESELEFEGTLGGEGLSRTGGYRSASECQDEQETVLSATIDGVQASDWSGVDLGYTYTVGPHPDLDVRRERNSEFEWEEVDRRVAEGEAIRLGEEPDTPRFTWLAGEVADIESEEQEELGDVGFDLLLLLNNFNSEHEGDPYGEDENGAFEHPSEYEELFGQLADQDTVINGSPPAAKCVVEKLPSVVVTEDDPTMKDISCAVCKDEIPLGMVVKQLPCKHHYHDDCILPWLEMRNTCPICRYELPTDDPDYERWKARRNRVTDRFEE